MKPRTVSTKQKGNNNRNNDTQSSSSGNIWNRLFDCSDDTSYIFLHSGKKKGNVTEKNKINTIILESIHGRRGQTDSNLRAYVSYMTIYKINTYLYLRIMSGKKWQKTTTAPAAGRRREQGPGRCSEGREVWAKWGQPSNHRTTRSTSSRSRAITGQNLV